MLNYITKVITKILKSKGPKTDSCGIQKKTSKIKEKSSKIRTEGFGIER